MTEIVQDPAGSVLPDAREMLDPPLAAVTTPPHVVAMAGAAATSRPAGKVSAKIAVSAMAAALALLSVIERVVEIALWNKPEMPRIAGRHVDVHGFSERIELMGKNGKLLFRDPKEMSIPEMVAELEELVAKAKTQINAAGAPRRSTLPRATPVTRTTPTTPAVMMLFNRFIGFSTTHL